MTANIEPLADRLRREALEGMPRGEREGIRAGCPYGLPQSERCGGKPSPSEEVIYLASPYSHPSEAVRFARFEAAARYCAALFRDGAFVFSPIVHCHPCAAFGLPGDFLFWQGYNRAMLSLCSELRILMLDGWKESNGVAAEIRLAIEQGKAVGYVEPFAT